MSSSTFAGTPRPLVVTPTKSVGIQILLVILLGPIGLFYSSVKGALIMLLGVPAIVAVLSALIMALSLQRTHAGGIGLFGGVGILILMVPVIYAGSFIWGISAVNRYNHQLLQASI